MKFYDDNPKWKGKADELRAEVAYWSNQCHDIAVTGETVPDSLHGALKVAENNLDDHKEAESRRYFKACKEGKV